jgi:Tfp pilus assembly protein PilF
MKSAPQAKDGNRGWLRDLWERGWLKALLLIAATFLAYQPAWHAGFIWDDDAHITRPGLRSLDGLARIWIQLGATQQYYPLVHSVFWVEHKLWGDSTPGYHLINILLHALSALLLVKVLRQLKVPGAWLAAAIFALHPVQVETVAWISELKNTLSGVFYLGAVLAYLGFDRNRNGGNYALALGLFALGLMSKTVIATLPVALLVVFWWQRGKLSWKQDVLPLVPFFATGVGAGLFTAWVERKYIIGAEGSEFDFSIIERFLIAGRAIWFYLDKLFWPANLVFIYPRWNVSQGVWWQCLFPAAALLLLGALVWLQRWGRGPLAGLLYFAGTLFPALGFLNIYPFRYSLVADHFQYLASIGPIVLVAAGLNRLSGSFRERRSFWEPALYGTLLLVLGVLTWRQCGMYANPETLWQTTLAKNPDCWMAHNNFGLMLLEKGRMDEAITHFRSALEIRPNYADAHNNLGTALNQKGQVDEAIVHFQKALETLPNSAQAHNNLGFALLEKGQVDEAIVHFQKALEILPNSTEIHCNLGIAFLQKGQADQAVVHFQEALVIQPGNIRVLNNLARVLATAPQASLRDGAKAVELAQQADQLSDGQDPAIIGTLAAAYAEAGQFSEAVATAQRALQLAGFQNNPALADSLRAQIGLYEAGIPFRDANLTNGPAPQVQLEQ